MEKQKNYSHIIWDWNGTLFDDVDWCIQVVNQMLSKRKIKTLDGILDYHKAFCFPIINYYKNVGFDFSTQSFEELAKEYISIYHSDKTGNCKLHENVEQVLKSVKELGIKQVILSASEKSNLLSQMNDFKICQYFEEILGLSDVYAKSKIDVGLDYISREKVRDVILIGDTEHDYEVAKALNAECIIVANGHQSKAKLKSLGVPVLDDVLHVLEFV
ncbi:HAD family hydrolase [Anaerosporobacter sp.]|uniref:HAD family hydrolase n=1 Tax=Anaerosporobacter sp. TaxID=1872529 RepID=UPI00286F5DB4|nr:HAD hydrolase-like protein [Anaerosporobacter sp.]